MIETTPFLTCPKCSQSSGNDWSQCGRSCPMPHSPYYRPESPMPTPTAPHCTDPIHDGPDTASARAAWAAYISARDALTRVCGAEPSIADALLSHMRRLSRQNVTLKIQLTLACGALIVLSLILLVVVAYPELRHAS